MNSSEKYSFPPFDCRHREDPRVAGVVVDEGVVVTTFSNGRDLSRSLYIRVDYVEEDFAYVALLWKGKSALFV